MQLQQVDYFPPAGPGGFKIPESGLVITLKPVHGILSVGASE